MKVTKSVEIGGRTLSIETGRIAKQAAGSALVQYGDTVVLVTAQASDKDDPGLSFYDRYGTKRAVMGLVKGDPAIVFADEHENPVWGRAGEKRIGR